MYLNSRLNHEEARQFAETSPLVGPLTKGELDHLIARAFEHPAKPLARDYWCRTPKVRPWDLLSEAVEMFGVPCHRCSRRHPVREGEWGGAFFLEWAPKANELRRVYVSERVKWLYQPLNGVLSGTSWFSDRICPVKAFLVHKNRTRLSRLRTLMKSFRLADYPMKKSDIEMLDWLIRQADLDAINYAIENIFEPAMLAADLRRARKGQAPIAIKRELA